MRRARAVVAAIAAIASVSSCASIDVNALPAPGNSFPGGYPLVMEFDNVLNLPARAKVTLDGITVGIVTGVAVVGNHVNVTTRMDSAVAIPSDIHASLQQATVLGDIYIALDRPATGSPAAAPLSADARIPVAQTTSPPQLEDTIAHLADFTGSGSLQRIQNSIIGVNRITPPPADVRKMATQFAADLSDLSSNINNVDLLLNGVAQSAQVMHDRMPMLQTWFSPQGLQGWKNAYGLYQYAGTAYPSVGTIYSGGFWMVPLLRSLADATGAIQKSKWAFESEVPKWRKLFTDYYLPQDKYPAINITSIVGHDGRELSGNVHDVLRILGAMP
ncbi:MlaD family protein [Mycolicibacterium sp. lyk4-40-TYG-92]|uniref:MlaD family protein n=1 Tax=Mycolicibacterium sp. lyk4-40-TYG-92 TaxID=3040295 RepID=UPI00254EC629|nr:MlaD family protein [Mycolicibacterium sp. lyk4-40-TYG-92]